MELSKTCDAGVVHTLDPAYYTSDAIYQQECFGLFMYTWQFAGHVSQAPNPGDYFTFEIAGQSLFCIRNNNNVLNTFYNVCQHRGNPLVEEEKGQVRRFVCKYHSWAYMPDGELNFAPDQEDFPEGNPCGKLRLEELRCETFAGFVWVNMDPDCVSLQEYLGPIWDEWQARDIHLWRRTMANTMWLPCNWKVVLDNFNESYHVPTVHMGATTETNRKEIRGHINTYFKLRPRIYYSI
mgnify:CR=1 FL=1